MGTYIIIGGDGKEYGPITPEDIRQWLAEGRLNGQSLAKATSDAEFRPLAKFPEFAGLLAATVQSSPAALPADVNLDEDYELDLGSCISRGWELTKQNFGTVFAAVLVFLGIRFALSSIIQVTLIGNLVKLFPSPAAQVGLGFLMVALISPIIGPLLGGIYLILIKLNRGEMTGLGELFVGFQKCWAQLFLGSLVTEAIALVCMAPGSYVIAAKIGPYLHQLQNIQAQGTAPADMGKLFSQMFAAYSSGLPVMLICLIPVTYLAVSWQFTLPLIIDKNLGFGAAMKTSWKRVNQHWWLVFGLTLLAGLIGVIGVLGFCIGFFFTMPICFGIMVCGYEILFNAKKY